jgi:hypothetical protein
MALCGSPARFVGDGRKETRGSARLMAYLPRLQDSFSSLEELVINGLEKG